MVRSVAAVEAGVSKGAPGQKELGTHGGRESSQKGGWRLITHGWLQFPLS